jgi:hypothetical protein
MGKYHDFGHVIQFYCNSLLSLQRLLLIDAMARVGTEAAGIVLKECITEGKMAKKLHRIAFGVGWVRGLDTGFMKNVLVSGKFKLC